MLWLERKHSSKFSNLRGIAQNKNFAIFASVGILQMLCGRGRSASRNRPLDKVTLNYDLYQAFRDLGLLRVIIYNLNEPSST